MVAQASPTELLRSDILDGTFSPGERLTEIALAERYTVGRGAIRGALVELRSEGLVDIEANRGAVVRRIGLEEAIEIAEVRRVLEALLAARAASNDDLEGKESLRAVIEDMEEAVHAGDNARYSELNQDLHRQIWDLGGHSVARDLVSNLRDRSAHHQFRLAVMPGRAAESLRQHRAIVDAILAGDVVAAESGMSDHLVSVIDVLSRWSDWGVRV